MIKKVAVTADQNVRTRTQYTQTGKARFFLLVDLRESFSDLGSGGQKKINKKALKMTS